MLRERKSNMANAKRSWLLMALMGVVAATLVTASVASAQVLLLRTPLIRVAGEDPRADPAVPSVGDARYIPDQAKLRVGISEMDPARFPDGCLAQVRVGALPEAT